jgi:hypothetical protein
MVNPFWGEVEHEKAGVVLATERGRRWHSVPVRMDEERRNSSTEGSMRGRCGW